MSARESASNILGVLHQLKCGVGELACAAADTISGVAQSTSPEDILRRLSDIGGAIKVIETEARAIAEGEVSNG